MKPSDKIGLLGGLLDLPLLDSQGCYCGIVDDVALDEDDGDLRVAALLVGPGAYLRRLPKWASGLIGLIAGNRSVRVPWNAVEAIDSAVRLTQTAVELGLNVGERRAARALPHSGAL